MITARMLCLAALACLSLGMNIEASQSPWPTLTPTPQPVKLQSFDNGQAIAQLALAMEEEMMVDMLPFKPPFNMDKKQMAVIIKLLKKAVKPVLKSERLRTMVSIVDDFMQDLENNQENKKYYSGMLDISQAVYKQLNTIYNDEQTNKASARTISTISSIYRESVLNNWVVEPINNNIITPVTSSITTAARRVYSMLPGPILVFDTTYINLYDRWSETYNYYVNQISSWTGRARNILDVTAQFLDEEDQAL